jgi:hypothetical protein
MKPFTEPENITENLCLINQRLKRKCSFKSKQGNKFHEKSSYFWIKTRFKKRA